MSKGKYYEIFNKFIIMTFKVLHPFIKWGSGLNAIDYPSLLNSYIKVLSVYDMKITLLFL